jgi:hypothetical protein
MVFAGISHKKHSINSTGSALLKMKYSVNKKLTTYLISVGVIRVLFIAVMILSVTYAHNRNAQKIIRTKNLEKEVFAARTKYRSLSVSGKKADLSAIAGKKAGLSTVAGKKAEHILHPIVIQAAGRYQVDPALVKAIIMAESGYNDFQKRGKRPYAANAGNRPCPGCGGCFQPQAKHKRRGSVFQTTCYPI